MSGPESGCGPEVRPEVQNAINDIRKNGIPLKVYGEDSGFVKQDTLSGGANIVSEKGDKDKPETFGFLNRHPVAKVAATAAISLVVGIGVNLGLNNQVEAEGLNNTTAIVGETFKQNKLVDFLRSHNETLNPQLMLLMEEMKPFIAGGEVGQKVAEGALPLSIKLGGKDVVGIVSPDCMNTIIGGNKKELKTLKELESLTRNAVIDSGLKKVKQSEVDSSGDKQWNFLMTTDSTYLFSTDSHGYTFVQRYKKFPNGGIAVTLMPNMDQSEKHIVADPSLNQIVVVKESLIISDFDTVSGEFKTRDKLDFTPVGEPQQMFDALVSNVKASKKYGISDGSARYEPILDAQGNRISLAIVGGKNGFSQEFFGKLNAEFQRLNLIDPNFLHSALWNKVILNLNGAWDGTYAGAGNWSEICFNQNNIEQDNGDPEIQRARIAAILIAEQCGAKCREIGNVEHEGLVKSVLGIDYVKKIQEGNGVNKFTPREYKRITNQLKCNAVYYLTVGGEKLKESDFLTFKDFFSNKYGVDISKIDLSDRFNI